MKIDRSKTRQLMARELLNVKTLAAIYGCSYQRMQVILSGGNLSTTTVGKLARALKCDVTDILETDEC